MTNPFDTHAREYDAWFDAHANLFTSELDALRAVLPKPGDWAEIGVGSGRFASALTIPLGVEPARGIACLAKSRGIRVLHGTAEDLPLAPGSLDAVFYITSLCFMPDLTPVFREAARVLRPGGCIVVAFLPKDSAIGQVYDTNEEKDRFFEHATLHTKAEILDHLAQSGFCVEACAQTLTGPPETFGQDVEPPSSGTDRGSFVAVRARLSVQD